MCHLFASIPQDDTEMETRSVRMNGQVTSIRLEAAFWHTLEDLAENQGMTLAKFLTTLHDEVLELQGRVRNFASLLRCACLVYLQQQDAAVFEKPGTAPSRHPLSGIRIAS
ncbi:ribbon-helix-helix domain-containing protein [Jiella pacifica]|uniref:Aryl-sulfate sulfotransferase n=1 Tax=Jiella pacifica TaxID=2696469 RepID=A0A6N9T2W1_9HYPH|nr:ribbon-helix-helix domain-containing protein [Jiella pacifica]NDW04535.1 aryl-sulfate sulfotransferase [Jiella pacifica]